MQYARNRKFQIPDEAQESIFNIQYPSEIAKKSQITNFKFQTGIN